MGLFALLSESRWYLVATVIIFYVSRKYRQYNRLKAFKGPFGTGFSELWHSRAILGMETHLRYAEVCEKYGPIARIGPNDLMTSSPELVSRMSAARSPYTRAAWFYGALSFEPGKDHVFSELDEKRHARKRQQMAAGYSGKDNPSLEPSIDNRVQELLDLIRTKYLSSNKSFKPMDLARKIQYFTLDVISDIGFGTPFGNLAADEDVNKYIQSNEQGLRVMVAIFAFGITKLSKLPPLAQLLGPSEKDGYGFGKMIATAKQYIEKRLASGAQGRHDMIASFVKHGMTKDELLTEGVLQVMAGSDTTATAVRTTMLCLMTHPSSYWALRAEIDATVNSGKVPASPGIIPDSVARNLKYLQAVIKEGIRVHPTITEIMPKTVPPEGDTFELDGKQIFLPGGANIGYCAWGIHRNKDIFGEDAEIFRPERWLDEINEEQLNRMQRTFDLMFGFGKYQCLGKNIAMIELSKLVFEFFRNFDMEIVNPEKPWTSTNTLGVFLQEDMWVRVTERTTIP
ncbi:cytochrome P450 [Glonium stellatum]|uniref:Cytochrome P450 monooxygenase ABA1 n=1 Tax=Glonium stellatum TaxID=574774 RepID=A0A8E2ESR4_9PEZI|nr:cytochrome P450 [Glonium stellatum]